MSDTKLVDSTHRYSWEVNKEEFDNCDFQDSLKSPTFTIDISGEESQWYLGLYPEGYYNGERKEVDVTLFQQSNQEIYQQSDNDNYKISFDVAIKTQDGYWPKDLVKNNYSRGSYDERNYFKSEVILCSKEDFEKFFVEDKVTLVATLVIYVEGDKYRNHMQAADEFVDNIRSISSQMNLTDFTIISGDKRFPCHRVLLAARSKYFEALFRNAPTKTELEVNESPELVQALFEFMFKGCIPKDIDDIAMDLILIADMYGLDILTMACEASLLDNLSPDNAVETLIAIDKVNHVSQQQSRIKVVTYIKKEVDQVVKSKDWEKFVQNYPKLITEIVLLKCSKKHGTCFSSTN